MLKPFFDKKKKKMFCIYCYLMIAYIAKTSLTVINVYNDTPCLCIKFYIMIHINIVWKSLSFLWYSIYEYIFRK